ncbi:hypothetical protein ACWC9U_38205 [Streptomyces sp. 900116325]
MHDYASTSSMPVAAPVVPWAIYLAGADRRYRLLAFDFDSGRHGADVADADAARICGHLSELGVPHLRAHSGPTGGQHVWVRLSEPGVAAADVRQLAHVLRQHYPSLDTAPLSNAVTGAVRPPGAPHRHGGYSLPYLQGPALGEVLARMASCTPPEVVEWLLARHPHSVTVAREDGTRTFRIVEDGEGPRLDRPRRALSERTRDLLATVPPPGTDRSALAHSILLGMARAGHALADVCRAADSAPGLVRLRDDAARGRGEVARQWQRALAAAAEFTPVSVVKRAPVDDELDRVEAAVTADPVRWSRPGGASDERILHALIVVARIARTRTVDIDVRRLAEAAAVDASTVSRRLRVLAGEGWVTRVHPGAGTRAATWKLVLPEVDATQGEPAPAPTGTSPTLLHHHTHDVWTNRSGLGGAAARIHWAATNFGKHTFSASHRIPLAQFVSAETGYTAATVTRTLAHLRTLGLLPVRSSAQSRAQMDRAAGLIGTAGTAARRTLRHLVDRELHQWWTEEAEWRTTRTGKKRGIRATPTNTIALPITAPARTRYGRFPTNNNRRADYRAARAVVTQALEAPARAAS